MLQCGLLRTKFSFAISRSLSYLISNPNFLWAEPSLKPVFRLNTLTSADILERAAGIEPASPAWKAGVMSHYTTPAKATSLLHRLRVDLINSRAHSASHEKAVVEGVGFEPT